MKFPTKFACVVRMLLLAIIAFGSDIVCASQIKLVRTHLSDHNFVTGELYIENSLVGLTVEKNSTLIPPAQYRIVVKRPNPHEISLELKSGKKMRFLRQGDISLSTLLGMAVDNTPKKVPTNNTELNNIAYYQREAFNRLSSVLPEASGTPLTFEISDFTAMPLEFIAKRFGGDANVQSEISVVRQHGTKWVRKEILVIGGKENEFYPERWYTESYRNTEFIVLKALDKETTPVSMRVNIKGGCLDFKDANDWYNVRDDTYARNKIATSNRLPCLNSTQPKWFEDEKAVVWDPYGIGSLHAAAVNGFSRILYGFNVDSINPQLGKLFVKLSENKLEEIEEKGFEGHTMLEVRLDTASSSQWRDYFFSKARESKSTNFALSTFGLASTGVSILGAFLSSADWLSGKNDNKKVNAETLSYLMANGGTFNNVVKIRRDLDLHPYIYSDLYYIVSIGKETRSFLLYSSRYALKIEK